MATPTSQPNILLIVVDQMRSTAMGCTGVEQILTPELDGLAAQGLRFTNAVSNTPACTPARATLLTGKHVLAHRLAQNDMPLGFDQRTLAHCLNEAGYRCGYIGKLHLDGRGRAAFIPPGPRRLGFDDYWAGTECNHDYFAGYYYDEQGQPVWFDCYEPDGQTELAEQYLRSRAPAPGDGPPARPWCLTVSYSPPHCPYHRAPRSALDLYPPAEIRYLPNAAGARVEHDEARHGPLTDERNDARKRELIAGYYAHISALDACVGRLLATLQQTGQDRDTIVVFTSDHGDMLFSHNRGWKCKPWRESVGIPLLVRWPGRIEPGRTSGAPVGLVDLMPTLLSLAGADTLAGVEGSDLSRLLLGDSAAAPESQYVNFPCMNGLWNVPGWRGVVTATHTYAATPEGPWLLYDDRDDPFQMRSLAADPSSRPLRDELHDLTLQWLARTDDDFSPPDVVAERYLNDTRRHNHIPIPPTDPIIAEGQSARRGATY